MADLGNRNLDEPITFHFTSMLATDVPDGFDGSNFAITIYKDGTAIAGANDGVTETKDSGGITGFNKVAIVTTHADYVAADYSAVVTTGLTTGGLTWVGRVVANWSMDKTYDEHEWYVDATSGSDSNHGHTRGAAKQTLAATVTASANGDTIFLVADAYALGAGITTAKRLDIIGDNPSTTTITGNLDASYLLQFTGDGWSVSNLTMTLSNTAATGASYAISADSSNFWSIDNCALVGQNKAHCLDAASGTQAEISNCSFTSQHHAIDATAMFDMHIINCRIVAALTSETSAGLNAINGSTTTRVFIKESFISASSTNTADSGRVSTVAPGAIISMTRTNLSTAVTHASATAANAAIYTDNAVNTVLLENCRIRTNMTPSNNDYNIECVAGRVTVDNCDIEPTKLAGTKRNQIYVDGGIGGQ